MSNENEPVIMKEDPNVEYELGVYHYIDSRLFNFVTICVCSFVLAILINLALLFWFPASPKVAVYPVSEKTAKQLNLTSFCSISKEGEK